MSGEPHDEGKTQGLFEEIFGPPPTELEALTRKVKLAETRLSNLANDVREAQRSAWAAQGRVQRLRNATVDLLGPVMLGGMFGLFYALTHARGFWDYAMIAGFAAFAIFWLRDAAKAFDDVTKP